LTDFGGWNERKDLIVLVADQSMRLAIKGILSRYQRLGIRQVAGSVFELPQAYDSETRQRCHDYLRPFLGLADYALVIFDREGCGSGAAREEIETEVQERLARNGWEGCSAAVVIDPELEVWVWSDSPHVDAVLGWAPGQTQLRNWLVEQDLLQAGHQKPEHPKEALSAALRKSKKKPSSSIFLELATSVSFDRCTDPAFQKLKQTLQKWFPPRRREDSV
jgi:hypothetical protein